MPLFQSSQQEQPQEPDVPVIARRRRRWPRFLLLSGLYGLVVVALLFGILALWLHAVEKATLPQLDGVLHVSAQGIQGPAAPVTVRRDRHGVPHIDAASQEDLFVAQGYLTAQDRLWQMDAYRRSANGELAEVMGPSLLRHDKMQRMQQFRNVAHRIYGNLLPDDRARLDAYARGVNIFIAQHQDSLPAEFHLLHYKPKPWSGVDSVSIGMMMVDMLDTHWYAKLARERISAQLGNPKLEGDLYPVGSWRDHPPTGELPDLSQPHPQPTANGDDDDDERTTAHVDPESHPCMKEPCMDGAPAPLWEETMLKSLGISVDLGERACRDCTPGSNSWVVAGAHTSSGKPLLSNDMHLGLNVPNIWYMADLHAPGFHAAGVTLPGMPFVVAGHNEHIAWGFTALYADVQDIYVENVKDNNYQGSDGQWHPITVDHEVIHVRGRGDVKYDVRITEHGPLYDPIFTKDSRAIALKWTLYDPTLNSIPVYAINTASNWTEFSAAIAQWCWPTQNVVYADDQGHIGYHAIGRIPIRPNGIISVPIQDDGHNWQGYIPFEDLPNAFDPPSGFLATANSRVTSEKSKYPLTNEWADPYRIQRIYKMLQGRDHLTPADMLAVQTDIYSEMDQEMAHRLASAIDHSPNADDQLRRAADLMRNWDGRLTTDSVASSIVVTTRYRIRPMLLEAKLGEALSQSYQWSESNFAEEEIVMHASPDWLPSGYKDWDAFLSDAVRDAMKRAHAPSDLSKWTYGSWHFVDLEHPLSGFLPVISRVAGTGPQPLSGDTITVKQVGETFGPSQRFTMDWSDVDGSTEDIVLGESSNPYSPYYRDQWSDYYNGRTFALPFSDAAVAADTEHTLRLVP